MSKRAFTIFGLPGSGKSIQAEALKKEFNLKYISTGDLARQAAKKDDSIKKKIDSGKILPTQTIVRLIDKELERSDLNNGIIFDNFPFNQQQLNLYKKKLKKEFDLTNLIGIYLKISPQTALERIASRKICPDCSKVLKPGDEGYDDNKCSNCGKKLTIRDDDESEVVEKRIKKYEKQVDFLEKYFKSKNRLVEIDGEPPIEKIKHNIKQKLKKYFNQSKDN